MYSLLPPPRTISNWFEDLKLCVAIFFFCASLGAWVLSQNRGHTNVSKILIVLFLNQRNNPSHHQTQSSQPPLPLQSSSLRHQQFNNQSNLHYSHNHSPLSQKSSDNIVNILNTKKNLDNLANTVRNNSVTATNLALQQNGILNSENNDSVALISLPSESTTPTSSTTSAPASENKNLPMEVTWSSSRCAFSDRKWNFTTEVLKFSSSSLFKRSHRDG